MHKLGLTAIHRKKISAPLRHLLDHGIFRHNPRVLDFGCGRGFDADALGFEAWDPHHRLLKPDGWDSGYDIVLMTYVLCVLSAEERYQALDMAMLRLNTTGVLYASVRADIKGDTDTQYVVHGDVDSDYVVTSELSRSGSWRMYRFGG